MENELKEDNEKAEQSVNHSSQSVMGGIIILTKEQ